MSGLTRQRLDRLSAAVDKRLAEECQDVLAQLIRRLHQIFYPPEMKEWALAIKEHAGDPFLVLPPATRATIAADAIAGPLLERAIVLYKVLEMLENEES